MSKKIQSRVKAVLLTNQLREINGDELMYDSSLIEFGVGLDSIATMELLVALEEEFKIPIDDGDITPDVLQSIESISRYISGKM